MVSKVRKSTATKSNRRSSFGSIGVIPNADIVRQEAETLHMARAVVTAEGGIIR